MDLWGRLCSWDWQIDMSWVSFYMRVFWRRLSYIWFWRRDYFYFRLSLHPFSYLDIYSTLLDALSCCDFTLVALSR